MEGRQVSEAIVKSEPKSISVGDGRPPYLSIYQERLGVSVQQWQVLVNAIHPLAQTADAVLLALSYCKARNLDPFKKPVHIVPVWNSNLNRLVETVWPGISELRTTAMRTGAYAGCDPTVFGPDVHRVFIKPANEKFKRAAVEVDVTFPEWAQVTVHRLVAGQSRAFPGPRVYWLETVSCEGKSDCPNDRWRRSPSGQLEKCAEAAALRRAFPEEIGGEYAAEEMEGKTIGEERVTETNRMVAAQSDELARALAAQSGIYPEATAGDLRADPAPTATTPSVEAKSPATGQPVAQNKASVMPSDADFNEFLDVCAEKSIGRRAINAKCGELFPGLKPEQLDVEQFVKLQKALGA